MTWDEFRRDWYVEHVACFTGIPAWLAKLEKADGPAARDVMRQWYGVLRNCDLEAAKAASHKMHSGEIDEPKGFDRHPAAIRKACLGSRKDASYDAPRYDAAGNRTFGCLQCKDGGLVWCWHPATISTIVKEGVPKERSKRHPAYTCVVRCGCKAGERYTHVPTYDPKLWCRFVSDCGSPVDSSEQNALLEWLRTREPVRPKNYESEFSEFEPVATPQRAFNLDEIGRMDDEDETPF